MLITGSGTAAGIYWWEDWVSDIILELSCARASALAKPVGVLYESILSLGRARAGVLAQACEVTYERLMPLGISHAGARAYESSVLLDKAFDLGPARAAADTLDPGVIYESVMGLGLSAADAAPYPITLKTASQLSRPIGYTCVDISYYMDCIDILGGE